MKERLELDDSFEEEEKDSEKPKEKNSILNEPEKDINILEIKTTQTIKWQEDDIKNYNDRVKEMTKNILSRLIKISIVLTFFTGIEFTGSYRSNSIGVLTISAVLCTDLIKFIITIISIIIIENPANEIMTYGYFRSEIIASLSSMLIVLVLSVWICTNSIKQMTIPRLMDGKLMIIYSIVGICFNIIVRYIKGLGPVPDVDEGKFLNNFNKEKEMEDNLKTPLLDEYYGLKDKDSEKDKIVIEKMTRMKLTKIQQRELIHLICDMSQCTLVLVSSFLIYYYDTTLYPYIKIWDDVCGLTFLVIMLVISWPIATDCIDILMEAAPSDVDIKSLRKEIETVVGVINIHDIHFWSLSFGRPCITMHIFSDMPQKSLEGATKICKKYGIKHITIQVEDKNEARRLSFLTCEMPNENNLFY
jgi:cation diffusion facilitator family transporter